MQAKLKELERKKQELKQGEKSIERNAEFQKRSSMSRDERYVDACERIAYARKVFNDAKTGRDTSIEQAKREMLPIIMRYARNNGIE